MTFSPVWVICALEGDEYSKLSKKLERQFKAISVNEIKDFNIDNHKWWKISNLHSFKESEVTQEIDQQGHPCDVPAFKAPVGLFDMSKSSVVCYAPTDSFVKASTVVANVLQRLSDEGKYMRGFAMSCYGVCVVAHGDTVPNDIDSFIQPKESGNRPFFSKILFQGEQNKNSGNPHGYDTLIDESEEAPYKRHKIHDLSVQIISHLGVVCDGYSRVVLRSNIQTAGAFSLVFEKEVEKTRQSDKITKVLFDRFCTEEDDERWCNAADSALTTDIKTKRDWKTLYSDLISGYKGEELGEICPKSSDISPWTLVSKYIIPLYFGKYIKTFTKLLHRNVHEYSTQSYISFGLTLENNYAHLISAHSPENEIRNELLSVWSKDNTDGAVGMEQCRRRLENVQKFYETQRHAIANMQMGDAPDKKHTNFPGPLDFPIKKMGKYWGVFEKYWRKNKNTPNGKESSDQYGDNILRKLNKVLKYHPIPLSLIARSILVGLFLPFAIYIVLCMIPVTVFNTQPLENGIGRTILMGSVFVLSLSWAGFKYAMLVLGKIKSMSTDYIGWYLYKTQKLMYEDTLDKAKSYYDYCIDICKNYVACIDSFIEVNINNHEFLSEGNYEQTMFQSDITKTIDGHKVIQDNTIIPKATIRLWGLSSEMQKITPINYDKESELEQLYVDLTHTIINMDPNEELKRIFREKIFPIKTKQDAGEKEFSGGEDEKNLYWEKVKLGVYQQMQQLIGECIELYVRDRVINDIADIAFAEREHSTESSVNHYSFTRIPTELKKGNSSDIYADSLIAFKLQPSVQNTVAPLPSKYASIICPNKDEVGKWKECSSVDNQYNIYLSEGSKSIASFLLVLPIESVNDLKV